MTTRTSRRTTKFKLRLLWDNGKRCAICGKRIKDFNDLTVDHIVPLAKGGKNVIENCQLAHLSCNSEKHDMMPDMYDQLLKYNKGRRLRAMLYQIFQYW